MSWTKGATRGLSGPATRIGATLGCAADCTFDETDCASFCGNGVIEPGEACDDFNFFSQDGCSITCEIEDGWVCQGSPSACNTLCGDALVVGAEVVSAEAG